jgi:hypothetical protein
MFVIAVVVACFASTAAAGIVCSDSSYVTVQYTASARLTISPGPNGETLEQQGITVKVYLKHCDGVPIVGVPREEIFLFSNALFNCPGGNVADAPTDVNGATSFTGSIRSGGCTNALRVFADGVAIEQRLLPGLVPPASLVPVSTNSQDLLPASPGFVDAADLAAVAGRLGCPGPSAAKRWLFDLLRLERGRDHRRLRAGVDRGAPRGQLPVSALPQRTMRSEFLPPKPSGSNAVAAGSGRSLPSTSSLYT